VVFIDAINVKVRDGQVTNRPVYVAIGVTCGGERDILGLWAGDGGEGAKFWLAVLTEIKNRGTNDVCIVVCDGLKGLPEAITTVWDRAIVQTCVIHLLRNTFRYASRKYWDQIAKDIRPVYTAPSEAAAKERFTEFTATWGAQYPAIIRLWENAWSEFVPFLDYGACCRIALGRGSGPDRGRSGLSERLSGGTLGRRRGSVNLLEVECGCRQVQFVRSVVQSAAGEPVDDFLEVADAGFDRRTPSLV
jgi:hypothetical protein